jgi:sec-independent protein translocase protein TatA
MNIMFAGFFGGWEIVLILAVVLILFGAKKLPELAKGLGQGIKEFKKATREVSDELNNAMHDNPSYSQTSYQPPKSVPETTAQQAQASGSSVPQESKPKA